MLGKDGRYVWDENVTSSTDTDLDGRKYIGSGKYDAYNDALKNRNSWDRFWGITPTNIDWKSYYEPILRDISMSAIIEERKRYWYGDIWTGNYGEELCVDVESTFRLDYFKGTPPTKTTDSVHFDFNLDINGENLVAKGSYYGVHESRQYVTQVITKSNIIKPSNYERGNAYSLAIGSDNKKFLIVLTFKNEKDFKKAKEFIYDTKE